MKKYTITIVLVVLIIIVSGLIIFEKKSPPTTVETPTITPKTTTSINETRVKNDINWDNKVDYLDSTLIKASLDCKKGEDCWTKKVGKTVTGDNPIYASDLDLNNDNVVSSADAELIN